VKIEEFKKIGGLMFQQGLVDSHSGNLSIRDGDKIYITKRDSMLGEIEVGNIVEVGINAGEGEETASRELPVHRAIYKETGAQAIVHAHPISAIAISLTDNKIVPQDAEGLYVFKSASIVRVHNPIGSEESARLLPSFLQTNVIAVIKGHGSFAVGKTLEEAYKYTSSLENSCKILVAVRSSQGASVKPAPQKEKNDWRTSRSAIPPGIGVMDRSRYKR